MANRTPEQRDRCFDLLHLRGALRTDGKMRFERLALRRRQRAEDVESGLLAEMIVEPHNRPYGSRLGKDGVSMSGGRCSSGGTTRITRQPSSVHSSP